MKIIDAEEFKFLATLRELNALLHFNNQSKQCEILKNHWEIKTTKYAKRKLEIIINAECGINKDTIKDITAFLAKELNVYKIIITAENRQEISTLDSLEYAIDFKDKQ